MAEIFKVVRCCYGQSFHSVIMEGHETLAVHYGDGPGMNVVAPAGFLLCFSYRDAALHWMVSERYEAVLRCHTNEIPVRVWWVLGVRLLEQEPDCLELVREFWSNQFADKFANMRNPAPTGTVGVTSLQVLEVIES